MPNLSVDVLRRYGFAFLSVGLACFTACSSLKSLGIATPSSCSSLPLSWLPGYGGYGPSLLALALSWLSVDYISLAFSCPPSDFRVQSP